MESVPEIEALLKSGKTVRDATSMNWLFGLLDLASIANR